jgi:hypothetical protein
MSCAEPPFKNKLLVTAVDLRQQISVKGSASYAWFSEIDRDLTDLHWAARFEPPEAANDFLRTTGDGEITTINSKGGRGENSPANVAQRGQYEDSQAVP